MDDKLGFFTKNPIISLSIIAAIAVSLRLDFVHFDIPITSDALLYFNYAIDVVTLGHLPPYPVPNNGWPVFLSFFFSVFHSSDFMDYMILQRAITIFISVATIIPIYLLSRKFFQKSFSVLASAIFVLEPRIIQNSLFGISDPLYIMTVTISLVLFLSQKNKLVYVSFAIIGIASIIRSEGLFLLPAFSILFFIRYGINREAVTRYLLVITIFALIIIPVSLLRIETVGNDWLTSRVVIGATNIVDQSKNDQFGTLRYVTSGFFTLIKFATLSMIPYLAFFVPFGILLAIRNRSSIENKLLLIVQVFMLLPVLYAYSIPALDSRYLLPLYPIFAIMSVFTVRSLVKTVEIPKIFVVLLVAGLILLSWYYLYSKDIDTSHEKEALSIAHFVVDKTLVIYPYSESSYLAVAGINNTQNFPIPTNNFKIPKQINIGQAKSLNDALDIGRSNGLTHLVIDGSIDQPRFFGDVFYHEGKYPYLIKIFDSTDYGYIYQVKIYKIDYQKYDDIQQNAPFPELAN